VNGEVARFVGHENLLSGGSGAASSSRSRRDLGIAGTPAAEERARSACWRPEQIDLADGSAAPRGVVVSREFHGHDVLVAVRLDEPAWGPDPAGRPGFEVLVRLPGPQAPEPGERVSLRVRGTAAAWLSGQD
jgi:hypothetical protein